MALSRAMRSTTGMALGFSVPFTIWIGVSPSSVVCSIRTPRLRKCIKHLINSEPVQPGSKGRLATKASNFSKELNEDLLCEVFSLRNIPGHPQAEGVDATIMALVELLKGSHVALRSSLCQAVIGRLCLGFGCGHVFVYFGQASWNFPPSCLFVTLSRFRRISRSGTAKPQNPPWG